MGSPVRLTPNLDSGTRLRVADLFPKLSSAKSAATQNDNAKAGGMKSVKSDGNLQTKAEFSPKISPRRIFGRISPALESTINVRDVLTRPKTAALISAMSKGPSTSRNNAALDDDYLYQAAQFISSAQKSEADGHWDLAFSCYKAGLNLLLKGVQDEVDVRRRNAVRKKIAKYLVRAERLYRLHINSGSTPQTSDGGQWVADLGLCIQDPDLMGLRGPLSDITAFRYIKLLSDNVILVKHKITQEKFAIKLLRKTCNPERNCFRQSCVPINVLYMTRLIKYYETESLLALLLEYADGGSVRQLWHWRWDNRWSLATAFSGRKSMSADLSELWGGGRLQSKPVPLGAGRIRFSISTDDLVSTGSCAFANESLAAERELSSSATVACFNSALKDHQTTELKTKNPVGRRLDSLGMEVSLLEEAFESEESSATADCPQSPTTGVEFEHIVKSVHKKSLREFTIEDDNVTSLSATFASHDLNQSKLTEKDEKMTESDAVFAISDRDQWEDFVKLWMAELVIALECLHAEGLICRNLSMDSMLLNADGHLLLTFYSEWPSVDNLLIPNNPPGYYSAPEVHNVYANVDECADFWSLGVIMYELLIGLPLHLVHPHGITAHTTLSFPSNISIEAKDLLNRLVVYNPSERLGGGSQCRTDDIRSHPYLSAIRWDLLEKDG